ncbi:hypothetical protein [Dyella sp.]|uniref:hypothetical protein n=1 Tax=Dyella sp. TaxID=1869338 RepID=UPI002ED42B6C
MSNARSNRLLMRLPLCAAWMLLGCSIHAQDYFGHTLPGTMCRAGETVLFACTLERAKKIAVCARSAGGSPFGDIRYRFGSDARTELEFPATYQSPATYASGATMGDGGRGVLTFLSLRRRDMTYSVYSMVVNPTYQQDEASESEGVLVERSGKVLANIHCDPNVGSNAGMLADKRLFGVAVPLANQPLSIFPRFQPSP